VLSTARANPVAVLVAEVDRYASLSVDCATVTDMASGLTLLQKIFIGGVSGKADAEAFVRNRV
jgi:hypothetical protein